MLISRQADEDRLVANIEMSTSVHQLETVTTRGRTHHVGAAAANAGSTGLTLTPSQIERLPIDGSDLATMATLSPGVVGLVRHRHDGDGVLRRRAAPVAQRRPRSTA